MTMMARLSLPVHSAHIGQEIEVHYRWHPLYGRRVKVRDIEQRGGGRVGYIRLKCMTKIIEFKSASCFYRIFLFVCIKSFNCSKLRSNARLESRKSGLAPRHPDATANSFEI